MARFLASPATIRIVAETNPAPHDVLGFLSRLQAMLSAVNAAS
jgi:hypothetical protein